MFSEKRRKTIALIIQIIIRIILIIQIKITLIVSLYDLFTKNHEKKELSQL